MRLGAHESIAGGLFKAFERAQADGAESLQIFTKNARGWAAKPLEASEAKAFRDAAKQTGIPAIAHGSYLVNLACADGAIREKSLQSFTDELTRTEALGLEGLVLHPGAHADPDRGIELIAEALDACIAAAGLAHGRVLLENTAGQGTSIGHRFEQLAQILDRMKRPERVGVCLDTCHLYAAGYDIASPAGYEATMKELDKAIGLKLVGAFHLNDCKKPLGCRVDRHEEIGKGTLGLRAFETLLKDARFEKTVAVLETPDPERYKENLKKLRGLLGQKPARTRRPR